MENISETPPVVATENPVQIKKYVIASVFFLLLAIGGGISIGLAVWQYQIRLEGAASHLQALETFACGVRHE